jgi:hypothetical protein
VVVRELMLALRNNFTLQRLNIAGNRIADDLKKDFAQSAQKADALSSLTLSSEPGKGTRTHFFQRKSNEKKKKTTKTKRKRKRKKKK